MPVNWWDVADVNPLVERIKAERERQEREAAAAVERARAAARAQAAAVRQAAQARAMTPPEKRKTSRPIQRPTTDDRVPTLPPGVGGVAGETATTPTPSPSPAAGEGSVGRSADAERTDVL